MQTKYLLSSAALFAVLLSQSALAQEHHEQHEGIPGVGGKSSELPKPPQQFPKWMTYKTSDHLFYKSAPYNWSIRNIPAFAADMYGTGVGHGIAYEAMVTGRSDQMEDAIHKSIVSVLMNPPKLPIDEGAILPTFKRKYGSLEKVFDWAHLLHFQTIDVLTHKGWTDAQKEAEIELLWKRYAAQPYAITGLPMNMEVLDSYSYSSTFRTEYPKVNALFWGYHWLQTANYDMLYHTPTNTHNPQYVVLGDRYRNVELFNTDREFMPMTGEMSPRFAKRFPYIANSFDNLHMLHDNVGDILATDSLSEAQKKEQIDIAIWRVLGTTHLGEEPGTGEPGTLHDHRYPMGMPGMGWMKGSTDEDMYMSGMGWMNMSECGHCSIALPDGDQWGATVSADGWTMMVRCMLCARDMAGETIGRAVIRAATEDPNQTLVLISDEEGNWTSNIPGIMFLEVKGDHPECSDWSRVFTSRAAFDAFIKSDDYYKDAQPLTLAEWQTKGEGTPETYRRIDRPSPYKKKGDDGGKN